MAANNALERDVVVSSRVRLARNYKDIPFAPSMNREWAQETIRRAADALARRSETYQLIRMENLTDAQRKQLVEHHLISYDLLKFAELSAALIGQNDTVSVMINEEDHLRIQGLLPGLQPEKTAEMVFALDDALGADDNYAFDAQFGFLTSCPTNVGTGMRASTMLHLPALATVGKLSALLQAISKLGLTVRGIYGEGSEAQGNLYQLSNQVTLGRSEEDTLKTLTAATTQIISYERGARKALQHDSTLLEDRLMRSYGELANARILPVKEFMGRCSDLRLAASLGYVDRDYAFIDALMMDAQDGSLSVRLGGERNERERNMARADYVRAKLAE